jgi:hypothetical protein
VVNNIFFSKIVRLWDNVEWCGITGQDTDDCMMLRMRFACWISKATHTHYKDVSFVAFSRQRPAMLRYTNISCLFTMNFNFCFACAFACSIYEMEETVCTGLQVTETTTPSILCSAVGTLATKYQRPAVVTINAYSRLCLATMMNTVPFCKMKLLHRFYHERWLQFVCWKKIILSGEILMVAKDCWLYFLSVCRNLCDWIVINNSL